MSSINTFIDLPICKLNKAIWCCGVMAKPNTANRQMPFGPYLV